MTAAYDRRSLIVLGALFALGASPRVWNAIHYPVRMGFDAAGNWDYIEILLRHLTLPAPDAGWSTAHPPLFYALGAAVGSLQEAPTAESVGPLVVLGSAALGLAAVAATARLVHRLSEGDRLRTGLAAALLLFLPVHLTMSAMLSEELLASALTSFAVVGVIGVLESPREPAGPPWATVACGAVAGLALLTKLSAAVLVAVATLVLLAQHRRWGGRRALSAAAAFATAAALVGGWFYLRNLWLHGYLYPHGLSSHAVMFEMPPGTRDLGDYLRFPLAAFSAAESIDPPLLHSVWAGTHASIWFDPHRHFLPKEAPGLDLVARTLLWTALVPTAAFLVGLVRGARRALVERSAADRLLVGLVGGLLAGYVLFTWRNPWFVTVKGSFLLGLATPFAVYASETLARWLRPAGLRRLAVAAVLGVLFTTSLATFHFGVLFPKKEMPGVDWRSVAP